MDIFQLINIYVHVIFGGLLLVLGIIPMAFPKGSYWHKRIGRLYVSLYAVVLATAILGVIFFRSQPALMAITLAALYGYLSGTQSLKIKSSGPQIIDNLMAVGAIIISASMLIIMSRNGSASWSPVMGYSVIGITITHAFYDLSRNFWIAIWTKKIWPIDHGYKMIGSYFALASAGSGNLIRDFQPWSQIGPSIIGVIVSAVFIYLYFKHPNSLMSRKNMKLGRDEKPQIHNLQVKRFK